MARSQTPRLIVILAILVLSAWISFVNEIRNPLDTNVILRNVEPRLGLDLRGGLQVLLEADVPDTETVDPKNLDVARTILESRTNALGVSETVILVAGDRRLVGEFPGAKDPEAVIASLKQTGILEFVDTGAVSLQEGMTIKTYEGAEPPATEVPANTDPAAPAATPEPVYRTIMTGSQLESVSVQPSSQAGGGFEIAFKLKSDGAKIFSDFTSQNTGKYLTIVLDKKVISSPRIQSAITDGQGVITGRFTSQTANAFAVQLRYGSLPVPLKVVETRAIGPSLGQESVRKSLTAGVIGLLAVIIFMALYYRMPGIIADLALITYALISYALFKLIPVTLTLPGIAGFILSIGMAVDANVLIFERLKEELRSGKTLSQAIELAWSRAWPSIRDSNSSTLITCLILYIFGNAFGASMVKGFSITLALGVVVSLFTAIIVTRTYLHVVLDRIKSTDHPRWFGM